MTELRNCPILSASDVGALLRQVDALSAMRSAFRALGEGRAVQPEDADVILLCTSSGTPVLDPNRLRKPALITSISTNVPRAHEIPPERLREMDVYCDLRETTPRTSGEMQIAAAEYGWAETSLAGDLPELVTKRVPPPGYRRPVFFRSVGLGIEDIAIANALRTVHTTSGVSE